MKYKLIERPNPQNRTQTRWYASPINDGKITKDELAKEIVNVSSLARGDISSTIESLIDTMPKYLLMGKSIQLGEFGTLRISFSSEGVDAPEEFNVSKISELKVVFRASVEFKKALENVKFEKSE